MADMMMFPDTVEEFMEEYKIVGTDQVYTNGTEMVPIFRMMQWFEHEQRRLNLVQQTVDTIMNTARSYSIKDKCFRNAARLVQNAIDGKAQDFELIPNEGERSWIPCGERLPEENGRYLVTRGLNACGSLWNRVYIVNYSDLMGINSKKIWWSGNIGKSDFEKHEDILAWMPLPEPYQEAKE